MLRVLDHNTGDGQRACQKHPVTEDIDLAAKAQRQRLTEKLWFALLCTPFASIDLGATLCKTSHAGKNHTTCCSQVPHSPQSQGPCMSNRQVGWRTQKASPLQTFARSPALLTARSSSCAVLFCLSTDSMVNSQQGPRRVLCTGVCFLVSSCKETDRLYCGANSTLV